MNTLRVETALTETTPGEFVTDGFRVVPVTEDGTETEAVYQSRSPLKAAVKAMVLTADPRFTDYTVSFADGVAELAGKANLGQRLDAERFQAIRGLALADPPVDEIVNAIKTGPAEG